jgi:16S rRNA (cytidine1402-2'-O)-methyltransferase
MQAKPPGILYLVPNFLDGSNTPAHLPVQVAEVISGIVYYIAESEKSLRAFVKKISPGKSQPELQIFLLNEHTPQSEYGALIRPLLEGADMALISDAGMPCIADPGYQVVRLCHARNIRVVPLAGPSSIILLLVASGFSGQQFTFHGYLPYEKPERQKKIKTMERELMQNYAQLFIETPYRNNQLFKELLDTCDGSLRLCLGISLTSPEERIEMKTIPQWRSINIDLHKKPVVFALGR